MARIVPNPSAFEKRNDSRVTFSSSRNAVSLSSAIDARLAVFCPRYVAQVMMAHTPADADESLALVAFRYAVCRKPHRCIEASDGVRIRDRLLLEAFLDVLHERKRK
jgi:hypothetical protein